MDISQYLEIFIEESKEHVQLLNVSLLELEKGSNNKDVINEIFRAAHTIKGMAATMGFKSMNNLTHHMENVLSEIRNGNIKVDAGLLDVLFLCLDALEHFVDNIVETGNEGDEKNEIIISKLNAILSGTSQPADSPATNPVKEQPVKGAANTPKKHLTIPFTDFEKNALIEAKGQGYNCFGITIVVSESCVLKSARAFIIFRTLEELGQIIKSVPVVQDIEDEKFDTDFSVFVVSKATEAEFIKELNSIAEVEQVLIDQLDLEDHKPAAIASKSDDDDDEETEQEQTNKKTDAAGAGGSKPKTGRTVRVDIERLDTLMNLVSELIIIKNGLETFENTNQNYNDQIEYLERVTTNLHESVMKVRMVPLERVFSRFPRLIRDLSRKLEKDMELYISGEETELDRTVIDEIGDPLMHLIRNSADHGIERPAVRLSNGKVAKGHIYLTAYQDGNNVVIEVSDDGNGIDVARVKSKAIEKGTISVEQSEMMTEQDVIDLLFRPSFSTAEVISDVSGRGVGLDVVKTKIEALGGVIEVKTELGKGSKFIIRLPLTLAIIQALMVNVANEKYAIPLNTIQNIEDVKISDIKYIQNQEVINLRGKVIPIIRLDDILEVEKLQTDRSSITVVIVNKGDKKAGFVVDSLIGQQEIVIKTLGKFLTNIKMIAGATILGDGEVALILDVNTLV